MIIGTGASSPTTPGRPCWNPFGWGMIGNCAQCAYTSLSPMNQSVTFNPTPPVNLGALKASCSQCSMHQLCLPLGLDTAEIDRLDQVINRRRRVAKDERLYQMGEPFRPRRRSNR